MRLWIDTAVDSEEDIRKAISFLSSVIDAKKRESQGEYVNFFERDSRDDSRNSSVQTVPAVSSSKPAQEPTGNVVDLMSMFNAGKETKMTGTPGQQKTNRAEQKDPQDDKDNDEGFELMTY